EHVLGIATMTGGRTSHSVIMARALGIPFVIGLEGKLEELIATGDMVIVDGDAGLLHVQPEEQIMDTYKQRKQHWQQYNERLQQIIHVPSATADGVHVRLEANMNTVKEAE